ncbi:MAG TPA: hypothetical protein VGS19_03230 [Streptosporangiaceae bacterium]|nr:hypothetical protein [Streptosporangiaceae bacterium]
MTVYLTFIGTTIEFDVHPRAEADFAPIRDFFRHLLTAGPAGTPRFRVSVTPLPPAGDGPWGRPVVIRRSSAAQFCFEARLGRRGDRWVYRNDHTELDVPVDAAADPHFVAGISGHSAIQVIDFVRDLIIRNEETAGTVILHAAGVRRDGEVYAIAGPKGAGKTTTLLSVLRHGGWDYFTGDKLFCVAPPGEGHITVFAWRDFPYIGAGTLRAHPELAAKVRATADPLLAERPAGHKILLDPDDFESWLGARFDPAAHRLSGILLPHVEPGSPLAAEAVAEPNARWSMLNTVVERSADTTFFGWQHYLVPDYAACYANLAAMRPRLPSLAMIRLSGTLEVDLNEVLREVA